MQIHGAHGYLINTFLSPSTNFRTDEYGGGIENRARLLFEIYDAVRQAVGKDYIVGVKFPFADLKEPAIRMENQAPFFKYASLAAEEVSVPVISVCGYRTPEAVEEALAKTKIAAVSFGRPLVREPDLPKRWKTDRGPAKCVSCNGCSRSFADGILTCQMEKFS